VHKLEACATFSPMNPRLSIIIPAYNEEKYIGRAIVSLRKAAAVYKRDRGEDAEIIVVDNNSADRTSEIAKAEGAHQVVFVDTAHEDQRNRSETDQLGLRRLLRRVARRNVGDLMRHNTGQFRFIVRSQN